jgi:hypothetical protein
MADHCKCVNELFNCIIVGNWFTSMQLSASQEWICRIIPLTKLEMGAMIMKVAIKLTN